MNVLASLLAENRKYDPVYDHPNGKLSNHLSMALIALNKMSASDERLIDYYKTYSLHLNPISFTSSARLNSNNWHQTLGDASFFFDYILFFENEIQLHGVRLTLKQYLGTLLKGMAEFHGLIRLAYAVEIKDDREIAYSLAYFAAYYHSFGEGKRSPLVFYQPQDALSHIRTMPSLANKKFTGKNILERLDKIALLDDFPCVMHLLEVNENKNLLCDCADILLALYASTRDFVLLHVLTLTQALRIFYSFCGA